MIGQMSREKCKKDECNNKSIHKYSYERARRVVIKFTFIDSLIFNLSRQRLLTKAFTHLIRCQLAASKNDGNTCTRMGATNILLVIKSIIITIRSYLAPTKNKLS